MNGKLLDIILVLILANIAAMVAIGNFMHWNMWGFIVAYWLVLTVKNVNNLQDMLHKKRYREAPNPFYLQRKGTPEYVGPFWSYDKAVMYAKNDTKYEYRLLCDVKDIQKVMEGDDVQSDTVGSA